MVNVCICWLKLQTFNLNIVYTGYGVDNLVAVVRFPTDARDFSLSKTARPALRVTQPPYPMITVASFPMGKAAGG